MQKMIPCALMALLAVGATNSASAEDVKIAALGGITGPIAQMAPAMIDGVKLAAQQVNEGGGILGGGVLEVVVGDSGCNPQTAVDAATKVVNLEQIVAMVGPHCSGATIGAAKSVAIPASVVIVSPSATSPELTGLDDQDLVFRVVPSDDFQGKSLANYLAGEGVKEIAVAYRNDDYGKGLAEAFKAAFEASGGAVKGFGAHEPGKSSYRTELASLADGGAKTLAIFDYGDGDGLTLLRQSLEEGLFENYVGGDGMKSAALIEGLGSENLGAFLSSAPIGEASSSLERFNEAYKGVGGDPDAIFATQSYDAGFLLALAIEAAGKADREAISAALRDVASAPGEAILPGEWAKAVALIKDGKDIDYKGAAGDHEFDAAGDVPGAYGVFVVDGDAFKKVADL